ncbi:putative amidophosphoribosyltransferase [Burkholderiales bacterium JOSHI_001]|nr:putative amidophosphoribosyltransferase [Burkholderiales bacterium JOSHI_001]
MGGQYIEPMLRALKALSPAPGGACLVCRVWGDGGLCADCAARFATAVPRCLRCGLRTAQALSACGHCLHEAPRLSRTVTVADYGFPWDRLLSAFKYSGQAELATPLARLLARAVLGAGPPLPGLLLPVPLATERLRERGYNQAWELARRLPALLQVPAPGLQARADLLLRLRDTPHQTGLTRAQRLANLRHAFLVEPRQAAALAGQRVALVDDVLTTGATAATAAQCLLDGGAAEVQLWVLARTPPPEER